jgi:hypothetical protein
MNRKMLFLWKKAYVRYATIHCWWYSLGANNEVEFQELENWFKFWHFHVKQ